MTLKILKYELYSMRLFLSIVLNDRHNLLIQVHICAVKITIIINSIFFIRVIFSAGNVHVAVDGCCSAGHFDVITTGSSSVSLFGSHLIYLFS